MAVRLRREQHERPTVDELYPRMHDQRMRSRFLRSLTAAWLVGLLGVLHTGLPTHGHQVDRPDGEHLLQSADHHGHGTLLVEQTERVQSTQPELAVAPVRFIDIILPVATRAVEPLEELLRPLERSPPPGAPRAPPFYI